MISRGPIALAAAATCSLLLGGCLERIERIGISPDGSAVLRTELRGAPEDFQKTADALPEPGGAWAIPIIPIADRPAAPRRA